MAHGPFLKNRRSLLLAFGVALAASCAAVEEQAAPDASTCVGLSCGPSDAGRDQFLTDSKAPDSSVDAPPSPILNPLCGVAPGGCVPGDPNACGASPGGTGGGGGAGGSGGADGGTSSGGSAAYDASLDGGPYAAEPNGGEFYDAEPPSSNFEAGTGSPPALGCNVTPDSEGKPTTDCTIAGTGGVAAPCVSNGDCGPGLACVSSGSAAQCRPYCCGDPSACEKGTYCAERPQFESKLSIPVCVPADGCDLNEPSPCPPEKQCKCKEGTACAVVKDDGTTSCVVPGSGRAGDACPCDWSFVCSQSTQTCLKICSTATSTPDCGSGKCQSVSYLPEGFGVCGLGM